MPQFGAQIDTKRIPIKGLVPESGIAFPTSPVEGQMFFRSDTKKQYQYINAAWIQTDGQDKSAATHIHAIANVTGLQAALDAKAATGHAHTTAQVTGLDTALSGKAASTHSHPIADLTATGTRSANTWLRGDGTWAAPGMVGAIPLTTHVTTLTAGWTGTVKYQKFGTTVTLWIEFTKASWATNETITVTPLPLNVRPPSGNFPVVQGANSSGASEPRSWWIDTNTGHVRAAGAGAGNIQSVITYQVPEVEASRAAQTFAETSAITVGTGAGTVKVDTKAYLRNGYVMVNVNMDVTAGLAAGSTLFNLPEGFRVVDPYFYETLVLVTGVEQPWRVVVWPDGRVTTGLAIPSGLPQLRGSIRFPAALTAAALAPMDTGWYSFALSTPNIPATRNYSKIRRVGNNVRVRAALTLTGALQGPALIDPPFPWASDTVVSDHLLLGTARIRRTGIAWYEGAITPIVYGSNRFAIYTMEGGGAHWTNGTPATFAANDLLSLDFEYEATPL